MIVLFGKLLAVFGFSYLLSFYKRKLEKYFFETNGIEFVDDKLIRKLNIATFSLALTVLFLFQTDYVIDGSATINSVESLKNSPFGFFDLIFIIGGSLVFSVFYGIWLMEMILFLLSLPFQLISYKTRKKFLINTKKKKGVLGFFFNFENPKKTIKSKEKI